MKKLFIVTTIIFAVLYIYSINTKPKYYCIHPDHEYSIDVCDDSVFLYTEDDKFVGGVKLQGQLDSLITLDNQ